MPLPTRSPSLRDPRKQTSTAGQTTTPSITAKGIGSVKDSSTPSRRKTLSSHRDNGQDGQAQRESRVPRGNTQTQESSVKRRQSLVRPSPLKPASARPPAVSTNRSAAVSPTVTSPRKGRMSPTKDPPKKTDMTPPPRPGRSASVRQPPSSNSAVPAAAKGHARHRSQQTIPVTSQTPRTTEPPPSPSSVQRQKAQLTTSQHHYPQKKPPRPTAPTPADPDPTLIPSSWPEVAALQTEMLQLSLLHSASVQRDSEAQTKSEGNLRMKYESVSGAYTAVLADEREYQRRINGQALGIWSKNSHERVDHRRFPEQIQLLSQVAQEVSNLSDNNGRYTLAIQEFETWFQNAEEIKKSRNQPDTASITGQAVFIDPLGQSWKDELHALTMTIELCSRQLQSLDILGYAEIESLEDSALPRIAKSLRDMADMMTSEIHSIRRIEADIVKSERTEVSQLARELVASQRPEGGPRAGIWKGKP